MNYARKIRAPDSLRCASAAGYCNVRFPAMALDHYVSQVHLKNFYSPELGEAFFASRKSAIRVFHQTSSAVCRIEENSTNAYLLEDRAVEEFLKTIEPFYNNSVAKLSEDRITQKSLYVLSGFISYVLTCSPAGMRIQSQPLKASVEETGKLLKESGKLPAPPPSLGGKSLSELLENLDIEVNIDPKYPQAIGITGILSTTKVFANSSWEILHNPFQDSPFFTSDFPVSIEKSQDPRVINRVVPLTPFLAIRIHPNINADRNPLDFDFSQFKRRIKKLNRRQVAQINQGIVRCAESMVFSRCGDPWVNTFIERNANFRIEPYTEKFTSGNATHMLSSQRIAECHHGKI